MTDIYQGTSVDTWTLTRTYDDGHQHMITLSEDDVVELVKLWISKMIDITSGREFPSAVIIRTSKGDISSRLCGRCQSMYYATRSGVNQANAMHRLTLTNEEMTEIIKMWAERL